MPVKLAFGEVLAEGFGLFFGNLRLFFHLVTIPWVISVAIRLFGAALAADSILAVLIEKVVDMLPSVMFLVAWQRAVLLDIRKNRGAEFLDRMETLLRAAEARTGETRGALGVPLLGAEPVPAPSGPSYGPQGRPPGRGGSSGSMPGIPMPRP